MSPIEKKLKDLLKNKLDEKTLNNIINEISSIEKEVINTSYLDGYMDKERNRSIKHDYYNQKFNFNIVITKY